ncbi:MAG TPA: hypothetical protein DCF86_00765, partial [Dehalococcoidia bacterium]|nr:hypothetical protein [Dehalococcoidia bacterium]
ETITKVERVEVPGETVIVEKEVVKTVEVPGQTVTKEVVKTVEVPGETKVVEKVRTVVETVDVVKTVEVPGETVVVEVEKQVIVEVSKEVPFETIVLKEIPSAPGITSDPKPGNESWPRYVPDFMPAS